MMKTNSFTEFIRSACCGIGQVMLQNNPVSGALMLAGLFLASWQIGLWAMAGAIVSTLMACRAEFHREAIRNGLYGFNGTLVAIAVGVFMPFGTASLLLMLLGTAFATWLTHLFSLQHTLPGFTAPFILTVWLLLGGASWLAPWLLLSAADTATAACQCATLRALLAGIGQVMFQPSALTGLLFWIALLVNSRMAAFYALLGTLLSAAFALCIGADGVTIGQGLAGYNGVLCAVALGNNLRNDLGWAVLSVVLSVALQFAGMSLGLVTLTAPFVLAVWIVLFLQNLMRPANKANYSE